MPDLLKAILKNAGVWTAFLNFVSALVFFLFPQFPRDIWAEFTALVNAILIAVGIAVEVRKELKCRQQKLAGQPCN